MTNDFSKSPQRMTFQKEAYIKRCEEEGKPVRQDYLDLYDSYKSQHDSKFDDPKARIDSMEWDLLTTDWILEKVRATKSYAQNLYAAMCNNEFIKREMWPILKDQRWSCSWRYAGGIIADMRQEGDYIDWYCSGISGGDEPDVYGEGLDLKRKGYVPESVVTEEIENDLHKLGWLVVKYNEED